MSQENTKIIIIDLFCGFGGVTHAMQQCPTAKVIAAVNHDPAAIDCHKQNHPEVVQFNEDITLLDLSQLQLIVAQQQQQHPQAKLVIWASVECTNFSIAKGGKERDADSRTLANSLFRYIKTLHPHYLIVENVVEFMSWGSLTTDGKPKHDKKGCDYFRWCNTIENFGYTYDWRILNAADYGAYTTRKRYFGIFAKKGLSIKFPQPTHAPADIITTTEQPTLIKNTLLPYKEVIDVLDINDTGQSLFTPGRIKSDKTFMRVTEGIKRYANKQFLFAYYGCNTHNTNPLTQPARTITTVDRFALVTPLFIASSFGCPKLGQYRIRPLYHPINTITTQHRNYMVSISMSNHDTKETNITPISEEQKKLLTIMQQFGITDIKMRLLKTPELLQIMGFPTTYKMPTSTTLSKKFIGNSVAVPVVAAITNAITG